MLLSIVLELQKRECPRILTAVLKGTTMDVFCNLSGRHSLAYQRLGDPHEKGRLFENQRNFRARGNSQPEISRLPLRPAAACSRGSGHQ